MRRLLIVAPESTGKRLGAELDRFGYQSTVVSSVEKIDLQAEAILLSADDSQLTGLCQRLKAERAVPVVALLSKSSLNGRETAWPCDDFVVEPFDAAELDMRLRRLIVTRERDTRQVAEGLVIDPAEAAVYLNGEPLELTFREYELLRYLAEHPGRVFSRDALLNAVWGYDYFGGDRTVDVHIRRLRGKIEDPEHSYIDTVRNMGYRFKRPEK